MDELADSLQGSIQLVPIVLRFRIANRSAQLVSVAEQFPDDELAHEAIAHVLKTDRDCLQQE